MQLISDAGLFVEKKWKTNRGKTCSLRWMIDTCSKQYEEQIKKSWYIPHIIGAWLEDDQFVTSRTALYENMAARRILKALVAGDLSAFVKGNTSSYILQAQPGFWQPFEADFNADALASGQVTSDPFGMELSLDIPAEAEGRTLYLSESKACGWLKRSPKLHRIQAPDNLLADWYSVT